MIVLMFYLRDIKKCAKSICQSMNETFICPMFSDAMSITEEGAQICMACEDGTTFSIPLADCSRLPIFHSSAEEVAHHLWCRLIRYIVHSTWIAYAHNTLIGHWVLNLC